jgi:hypothetical protein
VKSWDQAGHGPPRIVFWRFSVGILGQYTWHPDRALSWLSSVFLSKCGNSSLIRPWPAPSKSFPMHHSLSTATLAPDTNSPDIASILKQQNLHPQMHAYKCIILEVLAYFTLKTSTETHTVLNNVTLTNIHNNLLPLENKNLTVKLVKIKITQSFLGCDASILADHYCCCYLLYSRIKNRKSSFEKVCI